MTKSGSSLAERVTEGKAKKINSLGSSVELAEVLPLVPRGHQVVRKRKAHVVEPPRYETVVLLSCQILELFSAYIVCFAVLLLLLPTPSAKRWSGPNSLGMMLQLVVS
jgi:hypothetical protein